MQNMSPQTPASPHPTRDEQPWNLVERVMSSPRIRPRLYGDLTGRKALDVAFETLYHLCTEAQVCEIDLDLRDVTDAEPTLFTMLRRLDTKLAKSGGRLRIRGVSDAVLEAMDSPNLSLLDVGMLYRCAHDAFIAVEAAHGFTDTVSAG